ncbi:hypothetical protein [Streptomyces sp. NPDC101234]
MALRMAVTELVVLVLAEDLFRRQTFWAIGLHRSAEPAWAG